MRFALTVVLCTLMLSVGQVCWKIGLTREGFSLSRAGILALVGSWQIWAGFVLFGVATLLWFDVLSKAPLSLAYPLMSLSYVFGLFAAKYYFGETVSVTRWSGVLLICLGVALVAKR